MILREEIVVGLRELQRPVAIVKYGHAVRHAERGDEDRS